MYCTYMLSFHSSDISSLFQNVQRNWKNFLLEPDPSALRRLITATTSFVVGEGPSSLLWTILKNRKGIMTWLPFISSETNYSNVLRTFCYTIIRLPSLYLQEDGADKICLSLRWTLSVICVIYERYLHVNYIINYFNTYMLFT